KFSRTTGPQRRLSVASLSGAVQAALRSYVQGHFSPLRPFELVLEPGLSRLRRRCPNAEPGNVWHRAVAKKHSLCLYAPPNLRLGTLAPEGTPHRGRALRSQARRSVSRDRLQIDSNMSLLGSRERGVGGGGEKRESYF
ncbi:UNVERIFIED_CONTAM: hypothetical protein K2H54_009841, partial [Gekko kuhli]